MTHRNVLAVAALAATFAVVAAHAQIGTSSTFRADVFEYTKPVLPACYAPELRLTEPLVVNAIGISRYGDGAGVRSTPAHMLGAAIFMQPFLAASLHTKQMLRNELTFGALEAPVFEGPALGLPVLSIANSPESSLVAASFRGRSKSVVFVWTERGEKLTELAFADEVSRLRFVGSDKLAFQVGERLIQITDIKGALLASLAPPGQIRTWDTSPDARHVLVLTQSDEGVTWTLDGTSPMSRFGLPPRPRDMCFDDRRKGRPYVRFDSAGTKILVSRCDGVWTYDAPSSRQLLNIPVRPEGDIAQLELSPDARMTVAVTREGDLRWASVDGGALPVEPASPTRERAEYSKTAPPIFSADGTLIALRGARSGLHLFSTQPEKHPSAVMQDPGVDEIRFSGNNRMLIGQSGKRRFAWNLAAARPQKDFRLVGVMTLASPVLNHSASDPQPSASASASASGVNYNGSKAWVGFSDGTIRAYGLETTAAIDTKYQVAFGGDVFAPPAASTAEAHADPTYRVLTTLGGVDWLEDHGAFIRAQLRESPSAPEMTQERVSDLEDTFLMAEETHRHHGRVMLILYIGAHGWIGPEGKPVVLPGDADANRPETWIPYQGFVDQVDRFVGNDPTKRAIIIFDTCQHEAPKVSAQTVVRPRSRSPYVSIVESSSPGQYAWHWRTSSTFNSQRVLETRTTWGIHYTPIFGQAQSLSGVAASTMSVFPLASTCVLSEAGQQARDAASKITRPQGINVDEWLAATMSGVQQIVSELPDSVQSGYRQEVARSEDKSNGGIRLFGFVP